MIHVADRNRFLQEGLITALAVGGFFIILGLVFALTPGISQQTSSFFSDLTTKSYQLGGSSNINLPVPIHPADHMGFYTAVMNFLLGFGVLQIVILVLRLAVHSRVRRIAETVGNLIFWLGAGILANIFLLAGNQSSWFQFWSGLTVLIGVSLIAQFFVYLAQRSFGSHASKL